MRIERSGQSGSSHKDYWQYISCLYSHQLAMIATLALGPHDIPLLLSMEFRAHRLSNAGRARFVLQVMS